MKSIIKGDIQGIFANQSEELLKAFIGSISILEPERAHLSSRKVVEGVDTVVNLFTEICDDELFTEVMSISLNSIVLNEGNYQKIKPNITEEIGEEAVKRLEEFICDFSKAINFIKTRKHPIKQTLRSITTVYELFKYSSERRRYFVTYLSLIPQFATGSVVMSDAEFFEFEIFHLEVYMVQLTTVRNILLQEMCYEDFEMYNNQGVITWNKEFSHLEDLSLEPQRLTLIDQIEFRNIDCLKGLSSSKPNNQMFSFNEVEDSIALYECVFNNYGVDKIAIFVEIKKITPFLREFICEDYRIVIPESEFKTLQQRFSNLALTLESNDYLDHLNSFSPFSYSNGEYYSNVMLFVRFITNSLTIKLERNKRFQIHSGFIFEDRVTKILERYGFENSGVTRINRKEFDLVMTRNGEIHNFQCKNNLFEISLIDLDIKRTARINSKLCKYYDDAYAKEVSREDLIKNKLGMNNITHYIVSRFPVMSNQNFVVCFKDIEDWLKKNSNN
ncbi:MAG: hypothetical protein Q8M29_19195 [Bacteroidota bacterium]|nr:hypothetical protein [Bacteroidota bacterium]